jgi:alkylation response protein AidB-like acyl-CoA dehydrogenase
VIETVEEFSERAHGWLSQQCPPSSEQRRTDVAIFHDLSTEQEWALISEAAGWQRRKFDAGFGAIAWPTEFGGAGLSPGHEAAFLRAEAAYSVPGEHEVRRITVNLAAGTVRAHGTTAQQEMFIRRFLRCDDIVCQLFSEPGAGSDLASLRTRARADGDGWRIDGSKVWVSGAQHADYGFLLARTDQNSAKHSGITAFLLPMRTEGVLVRPIRQMTGGHSFNEVFFDGVQVPDSYRIGEAGTGWQVARTMLSFERAQSGSRPGVGGSWDQLAELAASRCQPLDPAVREQLVQAYVHETLRNITRQRARQSAAAARTGPEGSLGKLLWVQGLNIIGNTAAALLGPQLVADTGDPDTFAWHQHVLGSPGFRIAGGSDEIQRNIVAERVLGLPREL